MMAEQVDTTHAANKKYAELYKKPGPWITVYVDASTGTVETLRAGDVLPDRLRESLEKQGAAKADIRAVIDAVSPATGMPSPVSRYVLVRGGEAEVNEVLPGAMSGPEVVEAGPIPDLVPLLKARGEDFPYVVAEVGPGRRRGAPAVRAPKRCGGNDDGGRRPGEPRRDPRRRVVAGPLPAPHRGDLRARTPMRSRPKSIAWCRPARRGC